MRYNFSDTLFVLLLFLLFFIAVFLFTAHKGKRISNFLIGAFFLVIFLNLTDSFLLLKQVYINAPAWALWGSSFLLLSGPLMYFYTQSVIYRQFYFSRKKVVHFLPFLILFLFSEISYLAVSREQQLNILNGILARKIPPMVYLVSVAVYSHFMVYLFLSKKILGDYRLAAANKYSESEKITIAWLNQTIWFFLFLMLIGAANGWLSFQSLKEPYFYLLGATIFLLLLYVIFILFKALRNPGLFSTWNEQELKDAVQTARQDLPDQGTIEKQELIKKLLLYMQSNKPYLEPELTIDELATRLLVKPKLLSQAINDQLRKNFFEFINQYRIEEAKRMLDNPTDKKITVLEVMYDAGFNSKSSFNTLFKKYTGLTPSEFKRQHLP